MLMHDKFGQPVSKADALKLFDLPFPEGEVVERFALKVAQQNSTQPDPAKIYDKAEQFALRKWLPRARNPKCRVRRSDLKSYVNAYYTKLGLA